MSTFTGESKLPASDEDVPAAAGTGSGWRVRVFGAYLIALNLLLLYVLVRIWPASDTLQAESGAEQITLLPGLSPLSLELETRFLLIVIIAGALGSYIHLATSFASYVGNRQLQWSWGWWYILRPFIGMTLAVIVYFAVRGGLVAGGGSAGNLSPFGVAAVGALSGMFSKQATDKLRDVFENLFGTRDERADKLKGG